MAQIPGNSTTAAAAARTPDGDEPEWQFSAGIPHVARIYDALLGGKENYAADRDAARALTTAIPSAPRAARDNRAFLGRAVYYLAAEAGIRQFLDIGTGLPTQGNVHEIAQDQCPDARVVYVDNDDVVVAHGRALMAKTPGVHVAEADLRYPREMLGRKEIRNVLDLSKPVGVLLVAVLHFLGDSESPWQAVQAITSRIAPGSYVVVSHVTGDNIPAGAVDQARRIYGGALVQGTARRRSEIMRFFAGLDMVEPGLVDAATWRSGREQEAAGPILFWAGVGRKPGAGYGQ